MLILAFVKCFEANMRGFANGWPFAERNLQGLCRKTVC